MIARQLYQLQELDLEIESNQRSLNELTSQLGESEALIKVRGEVASEQKRREDLKKEQHSLEWEIDDISEKVKAAEAKLYGGAIRNPKELAGLQQETEALKSRRSQLEDKALDVMAQMDAAEADAARRLGELKKVESEWQAAQQKLNQEIDRLKAVIAELEAKRQAMASQVNESTMEFYHNLRQQRATAVARVEQGRCSGCRIKLATTELQRCRNTMVQCSSCGRILFVS